MKSQIHDKSVSEAKHLVCSLRSTSPVLILDMARRHIRINLLNNIIHLVAQSMRTAPWSFKNVNLCSLFCFRVLRGITR